MIQAIEVAKAIAELRTAGVAIHRCDGTLAEARAYYGDSSAKGWNVRGGRPRVGDLLVGVVGTASRRRIVDICAVERVVGSRTEWVVEWRAESDVCLRPSVLWDEVAEVAGNALRPTWTKVANEDAAKFLGALSQVVRRQSAVGEAEGKRALTFCRKRSSFNRLRALEASDGSCAACQQNFRRIFGARGDRALEAHHRYPLSGSDTEVVVTPWTDLVVLCATCHRLVHTDAALDVQALSIEWQLASVR